MTKNLNFLKKSVDNKNGIWYITSAHRRKVVDSARNDL